MDRPDYFWPVKENTKDTVDFSVTNVSGKFQWIFFLGFMTHILQIAVIQFEKMREEKGNDGK